MTWRRLKELSGERRGIGLLNKTTPTSSVEETVVPQLCCLADDIIFDVSMSRSFKRSFVKKKKQTNIKWNKRKAAPTVGRGKSAKRNLNAKLVNRKSPAATTTITIVAKQKGLKVDSICKGRSDKVVAICTRWENINHSIWKPWVINHRLGRT